MAKKDNEKKWLWSKLDQMGGVFFSIVSPGHMITSKKTGVFGCWLQVFILLSSKLWIWWHNAIIGRPQRRVAYCMVAKWRNTLEFVWCWSCCCLWLAVGCWRCFFVGAWGLRYSVGWGTKKTLQSTVKFSTTLWPEPKIDAEAVDTTHRTPVRRVFLNRRGKNFHRRSALKLRKLILSYNTMSLVEFVTTFHHAGGVVFADVKWPSTMVLLQNLLLMLQKSPRSNPVKKMSAENHLS